MHSQQLHSGSRGGICLDSVRLVGEQLDERVAIVDQ
jgi:hypothetical protein